MIELFKRTRTMIYSVERTIHFFRQQNFIKGYSDSEMILCELQELQKCLEVLPKEVYKIVCQYFVLAVHILLEAIEKRDEERIADIYQLEILPLLHQIMDVLCGESENFLEEHWGDIQENFWKTNQEIWERRFPEIWDKLSKCKNTIPDEYMVSLTKTGGVLLEIVTEENGIVRMNSAWNPLQEAIVFAENYKDEEEFLVVGWGVGYHVWALLQQPSCKKVIVLENDIYPLAISCMYQDWTWILQDERLSVVYCPSNSEYFKYWNQALDNLKICIWYPSVKAMKDKFVREKLEEAKITLSSMENMEKTLNNNFGRNIEKEDE